MHKIFFTLFAFSVFATDPEEIKKISETMGHILGKNLHALDLPIDLEALVKGLKDEAEGKSSPLADAEYERAITALQEKAYEATAIENLESANKFLKDNEKIEEIITLEKGKLQYKILSPGKGTAVQSYNTPLIRYQGRTLNGEPLQTGYEEELLPLSEALPGLKQGIVGMKEGETRILYIHPDLGCGKESFAPNSLLIFEVELLKADGIPQKPLLLEEQRSEKAQSQTN